MCVCALKIEGAGFFSQTKSVFVVCFALTVFGSPWRPASPLGKVGSQQQNSLSS